MKISFEAVENWKNKVWIAEVPHRLQQAFPGRGAGQGAAIAVVELTEAPEYDPIHHRLTLDIESCRLVVAGTGTTTLFIPPAVRASDQPAASGRNKPLIEELDSIPPELRNLTNRLLEGVRKFDTGNVVKRGRRWVGIPNYWTFTPQPRAGDIQITVFGRIEDFPSELVNALPQFKADRASYSRFKVCTTAHLAPALKAIKFSKELKQGG